MATALAIGAAGVLASPPAAAASYRFWTYWQGHDTGWAYANVGPAYALPADGSVDGWSFAVSAEEGGQESAPGDAPDFLAICEGVAPEPGRKRVALVIDPGDQAIAPKGEAPIAAVRTCVVAPEDATGYDVLRSVLTVRTQDGLVCGLGGYPADECAPILTDEAVAAMKSASSRAPSGSSAGSAASEAGAVPVEHGGDTPAASAPSADAGTPVATVAVMGVLGGAAVLAFALRRRRERTAPHA